MSSLRTKSNSPYIFLSHYDTEKHRRTEFSLKLPDTKEGWRKAKEYQKKFDAQKELNLLAEKHGIKHHVNITLTEGLEEFISYKKYSAKPLQPKTEKCYRMSVGHFINYLKDSHVNIYTKQDALDFIKHMSENKFGKKNDNCLSKATQGIITRHLHALWSWFVIKEYVKENIINKVPQEKGNPVSIPFDEVQNILYYFESRNKKHYQFIYFLLLTGFRVSTALHQVWEDVIFQSSMIRAYNVKSKRFFYFPIHSELGKLLKEMNPKSSGRIFDWINQETPIFWRRGIKKMEEKNIVKRHYTLHQFRKTFGSWGAQSGIEVATLKELYNHSTDKVTQEFYIEMQMKAMKELLDRVNFRKAG